MDETKGIYQPDKDETDKAEEFLTDKEKLSSSKREEEELRWKREEECHERWQEKGKKVREWALANPTLAADLFFNYAVVDGPRVGIDCSWSGLDAARREHDRDVDTALESREKAKRGDPAAIKQIADSLADSAYRNGDAGRGALVVALSYQEQLATKSEENAEN